MMMMMITKNCLEFGDLDLDHNSRKSENSRREFSSDFDQICIKNVLSFQIHQRFCFPLMFSMHVQ